MISIYILIVIISTIFSISVMYFIIHKMNKQQTIQHKLEKHKIELDEYQKQLTHHFAYTIKLLENITNSYRNLYQDMTKNHNDTVSKQNAKENLSYYISSETESDNDQIPLEIKQQDISIDPKFIPNYKK